MKIFARALFLFLLGTTLIPSHAFAASATIDGLSPGTTVPAKQLITFNVTSTGFTSPYFQVSDSFTNSSVSAANNMNAGGHFSWVPNAIDAGVHVITVNVLDFYGDSATATVTITVTPPPSASLTVSPASAAIPTGTLVGFAIVTTGFANPSYSLSDSFSGSTLANINIGSSGQFNWTPDLSQQGDHQITVYVSDASGASSYASANVHVGPLPTLSIDGLFPGMNAPVGTTTSFSVRATGYVPTVFGVYDQFSGSTSLSPNSVSANGLFSWIPQPQDIGTHIITITGSIGPFGKSASTTQKYVIYDPKTGPVTSTPAPTPAPAANPQTNSPAVSGGLFVSTLNIGSTGNEVTTLQALLIKLGFLSGSPTGYFGSLTAAAVKKFQAAKGISALGFTGPQTRAALNTAAGGADTTSSTPSPTPTSSGTGDGYVFKNFIGYGEDPNDGSDVMELQKRLSALGYFSGSATGYFGDMTASAVKKFQAAKGIPVTGYVGSVTRAALNQQ